jgi:hypothetical protein
MPCDSHAALTDKELAAIECRAREFQGAWAGTSGALAADVMRLLGERQRLVIAIAYLREQYSIERYQQQRCRD